MTIIYGDYRLLSILEQLVAFGGSPTEQSSNKDDAYGRYEDQEDVVPLWGG